MRLAESVPCGTGVRRRAERGAALVELAIALPLLAVMLVGTIDFGRAFRTAMVVTNAARAGAQFGSQTVANSGSPTGMIAAADAVLTANGLGSSPPTTAQRACFCATAAAVFSGSVACTTTCPSGQHLVVSVTVTASRTFSMVGPFPGLPNGVTITRGATARAQ